jgi:cytochrome c biogenesis protein CcdA
VPKKKKAKEAGAHAARSFLIELVVYAALVTAYVLFVIGLLGTWLSDLYHHHKTWYAFVALFLIVIQGVVLEFITSLLLRLVRSFSD